MKLYALTGKSGTGKSFQALKLCRERGIDAMIDDGLLISGGSVLAGISAKRQATKIGAVMTAIFRKESHRMEVAGALAELDPASLLVIGTSDEMVDKIAEALEICDESLMPESDESAEEGRRERFRERIRIEDITTEAEREEAAHQRHDLGKHVVPVPSFELKHQFSGYFVHPLRTYRNRHRAAEPQPEKTVVRPSFSYLGDFSIEERVLGDIAEIICRESESVYDVSRVMAYKGEDSIKMSLAVELKLGCRVFDTAERLQWAIAREVEQMTAYEVDRVDIEVKDLV